MCLRLSSKRKLEFQVDIDEEMLGVKKETIYQGLNYFQEAMVHSGIQASLTDTSYVIPSGSTIYEIPTTNAQAERVI